MDDLALSVRLARPSDAADLARIYIESWQDTYAGLIPHNLLGSMSLKNHTARWQTAMRGPGAVLVAEDPHHGAVGLASLGAARWLATAAMREELARVLGYPLVIKQLLRRQRAAAQVLAAFDTWTVLVPAAPPCPVRCGDADDQVFVDLAHGWRAALFSKDREVLALTRRLAPAGVTVHAGDWIGSYQK